MTDEQHAEFMKSAADQYPRICQEIGDLVENAMAIVKIVDPLDLLRKGYWGVCESHSKIGPEESSIETEQVVSREMINYVLRLVAGVGSDTVTTPSTEEQFESLQEIVRALYEIFNGPYRLARTAFHKQRTNYDEDFDEFVSRAELLWMFVQGDRHQYHDSIHISDLLVEHEQQLIQTWGVSVEDVVRGVKAIQHSLTLGLGESINRLHQLHEEFIRLSDNHPEKEIDELIREMKLNSDEADLHAQECFAGYGLFDVKSLTKWPDCFIDVLSISPGKDPKFVEHEQRGGWPNQPSLCFDYPFLKIRGKSYVFNQSLCMDVLYRSIQRALCKSNSKLAEQWNQRQKRTSENLALSLLQNALPNSQRFDSVHYQYLDTETGNMKWAECDGLVIHDNNLIVVEVKAGAFTSKSPSIHYKSHVADLRKLIKEPVVQGRRFVNTLQIQSLIAICDERHNTIDKLANNFDTISIICVTLDQLTDHSPQIEHLRTVGVDASKFPVWPVSIDDLRVVTEIFDSPIRFMHFLQERNRAFSSTSVKIGDELDHAGAYMTHNRYADFAEGFPEQSLSGWGGYRDKIDQFYFDKFMGIDQPRHPIQKLPVQLEAILKTLTEQMKPGYISVGKRLLDGSEDSRQQVCSMIVEMRSLQSIQKRPRPLSALGGWPLTIFANTKDVYMVAIADARLHASADLQLQGETERLLLVLDFGTTGELLNVDFELLTPAIVKDIPETELRPIRHRLFQSRSQLKDSGNHKA
tara:strand:+ start:4867 stop:7116 length:2250 start_codon:yes stop_codon:yes gene_type:complete